MKEFSIGILIILISLASGCSPPSPNTNGCVNYYVVRVGGCDAKGMCSAALVQSKVYFSGLTDVETKVLPYPVVGQIVQGCGRGGSL